MSAKRITAEVTTYLHSVVPVLIFRDVDLVELHVEVAAHGHAQVVIDPVRGSHLSQGRGRLGHRSARGGASCFGGSTSSRDLSLPFTLAGRCPFLLLSKCVVFQEQPRAKQDEDAEMDSERAVSSLEGLVL